MTQSGNKTENKKIPLRGVKELKIYLWFKSTVIKKQQRNSSTIYEKNNTDGVLLSAEGNWKAIHITLSVI